MNRREFIAGLGSTAAWPLAARAQRPTVPVVGFLHPQTAETAIQIMAEFRAGLEATGFVEGRQQFHRRLSVWRCAGTEAAGAIARGRV